MQHFSLLTYNLFYNKGVNQLQQIFLSNNPELLFFQEVIKDEIVFKKIESYGYQLAGFSQSFSVAGQTFGVATLYDPKTIKLISSKNLYIPPSFLEMLFFVLLKRGKILRTVLKTEFEHKRTRKRIITYNIHLSSIAMNNIRRKQIKSVFDDLVLGKKSPIVIAGDFNYPYRRRAFESLISLSELEEATKNIYFTNNFLRILPIKLKLDYILYKNLILEETKLINIKASDHYPIYSTFKFISSEE